MATTMRLAKQKVGRSLDAAETISTSPIERRPFTASSQSSLQRAFGGQYLTTAPRNLFPSSLRFDSAILFKKYGDARMLRYSPCYYSREGYIENLRSSRYASHA